MTLISVLPLLAAVFIFSSGLLALSKFPDRQVTRLFFLQSVLGAIWAFSLYEINHSELEAGGVWRVLGFSWLGIFPLQLNCVFLYAEEAIIPLRKFLLATSYLVTLIFGWLINESPSMIIWSLIWPLIISAGSLVKTIRVYLRGSGSRKREQELLVFLGVLVGLIFCIGMLMNEIMDLRIDNHMTLIMCIGSGLIVIGLVRHDLIRLSPLSAMESIMTALTDAVILTSTSGTIVSANRAALDILGYKEIELVDQPIGSIVGQVWKGDFLPGEDDFGIEMALIAKNKTRIPVTLSTSVVAEAAASPQGVVFVARDLSKRVQAQEQLIVALKEKEILLKETHHRVKNNLQVISSLLSIQTNYLSDEKAKRALEESRDRVFSMAVVHELLYQSEDLREIDFKDYTGRLVEHIVFSHNVNPDLVSIDVDVEDVSLDLDTASYIGLAINELIVNALVHGFPDGRTGGIWVNLAGDDNDYFTLTVSDNGVGLPHGFSLEESDSLGLLLVSMIADQIAGELIVGSQEGTAFVLTFQRLDEDRDG